jgi:hypothetical protein
MKQFNPRRADARPIEEKALGLIFAMDAEAAKRLHDTLAVMASSSGAGSKRARMFLGSVDVLVLKSKEKQDE